MPDGLLGLTTHKSCGCMMMEIDGDGYLDHCYQALSHPTCTRM